MKQADNYTTFGFRWQLAVILETLTEAKILFNITKRKFMKKLNQEKVYEFVAIERYQ